MEFQIAIVGPVTSLVIGAIAYVVGQVIGGSVPVLSALLVYLGLTNLLLGIFNLIPGFPLDGGRVLRSIIWQVTGSLQRATRWASLVGQAIAYLFILAGVWLFFSGNIINGLWFGFIGWFLLQAAQAANSQVMLDSVFKGVSVGQLMSPPTLTTPANVTVQQVVETCLLPHGVRSIPVVRDQELVGLITLADIRRVPRERWPETLVGWVMIPRERLHVVRPEQRLSDVLPLMAQHDVNQLLVVDAQDRLVGMISRDAIVRYIEVRRGLGMHGTRPPSMPTMPKAPEPPDGLPAAS